VSPRSDATILEADRTAYYVSVVEALAFLDARRPTGRRFGPDADARWKTLAGDLSIADRIDLLVRDGDGQWPTALGARMVFSRFGVAADDAFGIGWESLRGGTAADLWSDLARRGPATTAEALFDRVAAAWKLRLTPFASPSVRPAEKLVVVGPSAAVALAALFAGRTELDWATQATVVATPAAHRQIAGIAAAVAGLTRAPALLTHVDAGGREGTLVVSFDADPRDREAAESTARGTS